MTIRAATVVVIGAGQAGLSAGHYLQRRRFASALDASPPTGATFVILDANPTPGGAWQHRPPSLVMRTVNRIFDLPAFPQPPVDPEEPSRDAVPRYFAAYEAAHDFPLLRPVTVTRVDNDADMQHLLVTTDTAGQWRTRAIINATGTWNNPVLPHYPGVETFRGRQLHARDYTRMEDFTGRRVAIVGAGVSALQLLEEISQVATTFWYTRRPPQFREIPFTPEVGGRDTIAQVTADVEAGRRTGSVVSYTGLSWSEAALAAKERGAMERRPMFVAIEPAGVREYDGTFTTVDTILWATGYTADLGHLAPLHLQNAEGGILMRGTQVSADPRIHLIGYGPSQSTVGANRAGREAVASLVKMLVRPSG